MAFSFTLQPGETVLYQSRRHVWFLIKWLLAVALFVFGAPLLLELTAPAFESAFGLIAAQIFTAFEVGAVITGLLIALALIIKWRGEHLVLTTERLISESRVDLIWSHSTEVPISEVQHVHVDQDGIGPLLNFGDITIKSAAEKDPWDFFYGLPRPFAASDLIESEAETDRKEDHA